MLLHLLYIKFINKANKMPKGAKGDGEFWHKIMQKLKGHPIQDVLLVGD